MKVFGVEAVAAGGGGVVVFADGEGLEKTVEVLHVRDVAAETDDRGVGEGAQAFDVWEAGEGAVGCCVK